MTGGAPDSAPGRRPAGTDTTPPPQQRVGAVVVAAGAGQRMQGMDKVFAPLGGRPLVARALEAVAACPQVDAVALVVSAANLARAQALVARCRWRAPVVVCQGGPRRQDSVRLGLEALGPCRWVVVHDGARPLARPELVTAGLEAAKATGAAVAAVPVKDTIKVVAGERVQATPERSSLWAVQTPQVFRYDVLLEAHRRVAEDVTDDAAMVERLGHAVKVFMGAYDNLKVTTPEDLALAAALLRRRRAAGHGGAP